MALQLDGKIVVFGQGNLFDTIVARFNPDSSLDTTFQGGPSGLVEEPGVVILPINSDAPAPRALALALANGKIIVGGDFLDSAAGTWRPYIARLNSDGSLDPSFAGIGFTVASFAGGDPVDQHLSALAIDSRGGVVVVGNAFTNNSSSVAFAMLRLNSDGSLDPSFPNGLQAQLIGSFVGNAVTIQPDQSIVVVGSVPTSVAGGPSTNAFGVLRFTSTGSIDTTFGHGGLQRIDFNHAFDSANSVALEPNGQIVVAGVSEVPGTATTAGHHEFALTRLNSDGSPDLTFGISGEVTTNFGAGTANPTIAGPANLTSDEGRSVLVQPDGNIVVAGTSTVGGIARFALARYLGSSGVNSGPPGEIRGSKWIDADGDGIRQAGEPGVPGVTIFVDLHRDGRLDPGDPFAVTDANGDYDIQNVPQGVYPVIDTSAGSALVRPLIHGVNSVDFGFSVASGSETIAVGDPESGLGTASLFDAFDGTFKSDLPEPAPLNIPLLANQDAFGFSVAISSDGIVDVGSPFRWEPFRTRNGALLFSHGAVFSYSVQTGQVISGSADLQRVESAYLDRPLVDGPLEEAVGMGTAYTGLAIAAGQPTAQNQHPPFFIAGGWSVSSFEEGTIEYDWHSASRLTNASTFVGRR